SGSARSGASPRGGRRCGRSSARVLGVYARAPLQRPKRRSPWDDTGSVSAIDLVLVLLLVLSAFGGYRRGAILQAFGLLGVAVGVTAGALLAQHASSLAGRDVAARVAVAVGVVLIGAVIGNTLGWLVGTRVRRHVRGPRAAKTDA